MNALDLLTRFGHVDPADEPVLDAAAMAVLDAPDLGHAPKTRSRWPRRTFVSVAAAAAAAIALTGVSLTTGTGTPPVAGSHATAVPSRAAPHAGSGHAILAHLVSNVLSSPAPAGNATLVLRSQVVGSGAPIPGADLYTDAGKYYYAPTEAGLPAQVSAGNDQGDGLFAREIAAAEQAATGSLPGAAQAMEVAPDPTVSAPTSALLADDWLWENSLDALVAGSGNPTVRAGVMRLLSTLPEVKVANTTADGVPAVQLTATFPNTSKCASNGLDPGATDPSLQKACATLGGGFHERLTIDAATGTPISFSGGTAGRPSYSVITYQVSRVTASLVAQGQFATGPAQHGAGA